MAKKKTVTPEVEATEVIEEVKPVVEKKVVKKATVSNCENVNVRKAADKQAPVAMVAPKNTTFALEEELEGWVKITIGAGRSGYIMKDFVTIK